MGAASTIDTSDSLGPDGDVLGFEQIDRTQVAIVGGKGAHLGELSRGRRGPRAGRVLRDDRTRSGGRWRTRRPLDDRLDRLARLGPHDRDAIRTLSAEIRRSVEEIGVPDDVAAAITASGRRARRGRRLRRAVQRDGRGPADGLVRRTAGHVPEHHRVGGDPAARQPVLGLAVHRAGRDLPDAQRRRPPQGPHGRGRAADGRPGGVRCAVHGRPRDRRTARSSPSRPRSGSARRWSPGSSNPDVYRVRDGEIISTAIATKQRAIDAVPSGGTQRAGDRSGASGPAGADRRPGACSWPQLGRRIEAHFGDPQDIEWCLVDDGFEIVQSRPITTLFPIPAIGDARAPRLPLRRSPADDDGPDEAPRALAVPAHRPAADARGGRPAVRRRHRPAGLAVESRRRPRPHREVRPADR